MASDIAKVILAATPDIGVVKHSDFEGYVIVLNRRKKTDEGWQNIESPYMQVDGRLAMANADHAKQGKRLDFANPQVLVDNDEQLTILVMVTSEIYGTRHGIATSRRVGGAPNEKDFPWETCETSAIGRALGAMGYGLLPGSGLPSAEDMERTGHEGSHAPRRNTGAQRSGAPANGGNDNQAAYSRSHPPLSPVQRHKLAELWKVLHGGTDDEIAAGLEALWQDAYKHPVGDATYEEGARLTGQLLSELRNKNANPTPAPTQAPHWIDDEAKRALFWGEAKKLGFDHDGVHRVLGVTGMREYSGSGNEALTALKNHKATAKA